MGKIVVIGGGYLGSPEYPKHLGKKIPSETTRIDKEIIRLSGKKRPKVLFMPAPGYDHELYTKAFKKQYNEKLGCKVNVLYLTKGFVPNKIILTQILSSDIVYVGGGITLKMMTLWRKLKVDKILKKALKKGVVLTGVSAGSICWFKYGSSDPGKFPGDINPLIKVRGLGFIDALYCPHYDVEKHRRIYLKIMMKSTQGIAIALDNCCALEVVDNEYRIINSKPNACAYKIYWKNAKFHKEIIEMKKDFTPLKILLTK
ncbi:MAG: Type 1 glutamine amidotransferase-like domain-containing protein [Nanoarchaeota archaeon]|nr:Type 1 glutamine amidotransferase-like domain-containing protein [Nanoarchaeota archaeon]